MASLDGDAVKAALAKVKDPLFDRDLVALGYVKKAEGAGQKATVELLLPSPAHPARKQIEAEARAALTEAGASEIALEMKSEVSTRLGKPGGDRMPGVKNIIAVAAGKGGVGKSTVATNLALALRQHGATVGLLDADIYGPSVPTMLGEPDVPAGTAVGKRITPAVHWGIRVMSVGFFVEREGAVVWRGPMVHKLLQQFIEDVEWGNIDYLIVDLPPGTGDAQLSLSQLIPITGAVIVTTPQEIALIDVVKAISMFKKVEIPVLGVVENMSYYVCPACGHHDEIFSRGGGRRLAEELKVSFFGEVPIDAKVRHGGDHGRPVVVGAPDSEHAKIFLDLAAKVAGDIIKINGPSGGTGRRAPGLVQIR
ncbi:MAG TPA: iron-sulfur cluster carrier protein ApbC [Polyangia bacterium]|jgi:ATP-binding protein involved in chromosome partitioning